MTPVDEYARYATLYDPLIGPFLRPLHAGALDALGLERGGTMVDLCCGTGLLAGLAARRGLRPLGVDVSGAMLEVARRKHPAIPFLRGDASDTGLPEGAFGGVTLSFALHEKPEATARAIFREAMRLVRPGGVVAVADYVLPPKGTSRWTGWGIRLVERMAGETHHTCFRHFMARGGTAAFLEREGGYDECIPFMSGWAGVLTVHK
ncbi:methyltransferase domain-containing protein [Pseudodesulfovibrio cashew]|uniref:Methyltransferase domain-containing protein n=1 Tax=Pseudodesulfovibrio cashew TaxID=2678688 RepID=A0A6I6JAR5_9BACT|nr:class I SAM-dependent methyltransferase [Pseudodesulfovibrio cashew]QGY39161.1 methyltransferase domain-containing protein [Pseudodesulfovibrio cashew]